MLKALYGSPALRTAAAFGIGGVAFSVGNLWLAKLLPPTEYGYVSLVIGLVSLAVLVAPLGIDLAIVRRGWPLGAALRRASLGASLLTGLVAATLGAVLYRLQVPLLICLLIACVAGGVTQATSAHFQSQRQFGISVLLLQASNWAVVIAGLLTAFTGVITATAPCATMASIGIITAMGGWILVAKRTRSAEPLPIVRGLWTESASLLTMNAASATFMQLERLIIPATIGINELARFGVLAALVGSPFRIIQSAVVFTLVPRLREAGSTEARRQLLAREGLLIATVCLLGSLGIWVAAPYIIQRIFAGRYEVSNSLMLATLISGILKVLSAFAMAAASTMAPARSLHMLGLGSWVCVGFAIFASFAAGRWGLTGVLYAVSAGWLIRCVLAAWISVPHLRHASLAA